MPCVFILNCYCEKNLRSQQSAAGPRCNSTRRALINMNRGSAGTFPACPRTTRFQSHTYAERKKKFSTILYFPYILKPSVPPIRTVACKNNKQWRAPKKLLVKISHKKFNTTRSIGNEIIMYKYTGSPIPFVQATVC